MVRQAREMVAAGELGEIRLVQAEYPQDWLTTDIETTGQKQAEWRTDPGALGRRRRDRRHRHARLQSRLLRLRASRPRRSRPTSRASSQGRALDDNVHVMLRYANGARGMLWASQVAPGNENGLVLRVYGTKGGIEWAQENPNYLWFTPLNEQKRLITRGGAGSGEAAARVTRVPPGHPEGYLEGFANIYKEAAAAIRAAREGKAPDADVIFPTVEDGVKGVAFVEACVRSSKRNAAWVTL